MGIILFVVNFWSYWGRDWHAIESSEKEILKNHNWLEGQALLNARIEALQDAQLAALKQQGAAIPNAVALGQQQAWRLSLNH